MEFRDQPRYFLLLADPSNETEVAREILQSPLGLAKEVVCKMFRHEFQTLRDVMDVIKEFSAGIKRARSLSDYSVADYYSLMFAFHQWFHSSYRARQGKVLEAVIRRVLQLHTTFSYTPESVRNEILPLLQKVFETSDISTLDVDVFGATPDYSKIILLQLRSRDDTGGTTAKSSLVDLLRDLLRSRRTPHARILYLVGVWDERNAQQRFSTIRKIYSALKENIDISEGEFQRVETGLAITPQITLRLAYGVDQILSAIFEWDDPDMPHDTQAARNIISTVEQWDDLWISYAIASIELEIEALTGSSNVQLLIEKCNALEIDLDHRSFPLLQRSIEKAVEKLIPAWSEPTLPVRSPAEQACYLRDLLFLWAIYQRYCSHSSEETMPQIRDSQALYQVPLFPISLPTEANTFPEPVNFRALVPEISDTTYLTHGLFYYPAKFIPQIPRFCLREYTHEGDWVIDPFAGSGTVGLEAVLMRRHAVLMDINPLLNHIVPLKIQFRHLDVNRTALMAQLQAMRQNREEFRPAWSNLDYWYDANILATLAGYWGWIKQQPRDDPYVHIIQAALLKASRHFSYAEHKIPKLFKSKSKRAAMENLLQQDWRKALDELIDQTALDTYRRAKMLARMLYEGGGFRVQTLAFGGVDSANFSPHLEIKAQALITSPPYLQAQEYIRTSKLELYWLGYSEEEIKRISRLEIPYRKAEQIIHTPTLDGLRQAIGRADLRAILDSYFYYTLRALENAADLLAPRGYLCVFVGNPRIDEYEVETWRILSEYFGERGFRLLHVYEDEIKNRQLFRGRKNKNPRGMKSEFLLIMQKQ